MKKNLVFGAVVVALLVVVGILGYMLYEERRFSDVLYHHMTQAQKELAAIKNACSTVPVPDLSATIYRSAEIERLLVASGIAVRMLDHVKLHNGSLLPPVTFGIEKCNFWLELVGSDMWAVIETPNTNPLNLEKTPRVQQLFQIEEGESFGASDETPLTPEQFTLVKQILGS